MIRTAFFRKIAEHSTSLFQQRFRHAAVSVTGRHMTRNSSAYIILLYIKGYPWLAGWITGLAPEPLTDGDDIWHGNYIFAWEMTPKKLFQKSQNVFTQHKYVYLSFGFVTHAGWRPVISGCGRLCHAFKEEGSLCRARLEQKRAINFSVKFQSVLSRSVSIP